MRALEVERLIECDEDLARQVVDAAFQVHQTLGPGLLESVYELALLEELASVGIDAARQVEVPAYYKGKLLGTGFRADILVEGQLLLEIKSVEDFSSVHIAQVITYLKLLHYKRGFLLNFNTKYFKDGVKRVSI